MRRVFFLVMSLLSAGSTSAQERVSFDRQVLPILMQHCASCHGAEEASGELRLHSPEAIREFDVEYLLAPGKPEESALINRLTLAEDDDLRMPKGAEPLARSEINLIREWITQGADMSISVSANLPGKSDAIDVPPADPELLQQLRKVGAYVTPIYAGSHLLHVSFRYSEASPTDKQLSLLIPIAKQVSSLDLGGRPINPSDLSFLSSLDNLRQLNLENTGIEDTSLVHLSQLARLEHLNLHSSPITDKGLQALKTLKNLRSLHLWNTHVSYDAAMSLKKNLPELEVNLGWNHPQTRKTRLNAELERVRRAKADAIHREQEARNDKQLAEEREAKLKKELSNVVNSNRNSRALPATQSELQQAQ